MKILYAEVALVINTKRNNRLETYRGDTGILSINVAGYNFAEGDYAILSVKKDLEDVDYILQKMVDRFEDNKIVFIFTEKDTNIEAGLYQYDVKIYLSDGRRDRLITPSEFEIFEGVTHD